MGTHPIFESDFDCLTEWLEPKLENVKSARPAPLYGMKAQMRSRNMRFKKLLINGARAKVSSTWLNGKDTLTQITPGKTLMTFLITLSIFSTTKIPQKRRRKRVQLKKLKKSQWSQKLSQLQDVNCWTTLFITR